MGSYREGIAVFRQRQETPKVAPLELTGIQVQSPLSQLHAAMPNALHILEQSLSQPHGRSSGSGPGVGAGTGGGSAFSRVAYDGSIAMPQMPDGEFTERAM